MNEIILRLTDVHAHIGQHHILQGVSLRVKTGDVTILLGRNGAGKSTTLRAIMGLTPVTSGSIVLGGNAIQGRKPYHIARMGVGFVAEDRAILYNLTVAENFRLSMLTESDATRKRMEGILQLFPDLNRFWDTKAGLLSGGQKQMLAIGRVLVNDHRILLIDEPSKGLAPILVTQLGESLIRIREKTTIVLVEQNFGLARQVGGACFILDDGRMVHEDQMTSIAQDRGRMKKYLGIG
jgi:branched-chain amino acid transport system ATP-binding protein